MPHSNRSIGTRFVLAAVVVMLTAHLPTAQSLASSDRDCQYVVVIAAPTRCSRNVGRDLENAALSSAVFKGDSQQDAVLDATSIEEVRYLAVAILEAYLRTGAALRDLCDNLQIANLKALPVLFIILESFCTEIGLEPEFCRLPTCFLSDHKVKLNQECPSASLPLDDEMR